MRDSSRGQVNLPDVILSVVVLIGILTLAPIIYKFIDMVSKAADPFTALVLQLAVPLLLLGLIVSVGVSARRGI